MSQNIIHLTIVQNTLQIQYVHKHHNFWDLIKLTQFVRTGQLLNETGHGWQQCSL